MTATMTDQRERSVPDSPRTPTLGTLAQLLALGTPKKTKIVDLGEAGKYKVQELTQGEIEEIRHAVIKQDATGEGRSADLRGSQAKAVACALVHEDGSKFFTDPLVQYITLQALSITVMEKLYAAVAELSGLGEEKEKLGKDSAPTTSSTGASG